MFEPKKLQKVTGKVTTIGVGVTFQFCNGIGNGVTLIPTNDIDNGVTVEK